MTTKKGTKRECLKLGTRPIMPTLWDAEAEGSTLVPDKPGLYDSPNQAMMVYAYNPSTRRMPNQASLGYLRRLCLRNKQYLCKA